VLYANLEYYTLSDSELKTFAQSKMDDIELEIQKLRGELNGNI
jgi:hypothetical protein